MTQWEECSEPRTPESGDREYREDFDTETHETEGTSIDIRPDAISVDHQTAFTLGPIAIADPSQGLLVRVWRVRYDGEVVWITPARMDNGGWLTKIALFSVQDGLGPLTEIDFAFEQTGNPVICAERPTGPDGSPEIWIYFYDPTIPGQVFRNFGAGRTPRALLDRPLEIADSDVCVFYVDDEAGRIVYRQQRERYGTVHLTPATTDEDTFIEDVAKMADRRVIVLYSRRDREAGRYTLHQLTSTLMPVAAEDELLTATHALTSVELDQVIRAIFIWDEEKVSARPTILDLILREPVIEYSASDDESISAVGSLSFFDVSSVVLDHIVVEEDATTAKNNILGVEVVLTITIDISEEIGDVSASGAISGIILEDV